MRHHQYIHPTTTSSKAEAEMMRFHDIDSNNHNAAAATGSSSFDDPTRPAFCSSYFQQRSTTISRDMSKLMLPMMSWNTTSPVLESSSSSPTNKELSLVEKTLEDVIAMFDDGAFEPTPIREGASQDLPLPTHIQVSEWDESSESSFENMTLDSSRSSTTSYWNPESSDLLANEDIPEDDTTTEEAPSPIASTTAMKKRMIIKTKKNIPIKAKAVPVTASSSSSSLGEKYSPKFRVYQKEKWWERYEELVDFYKVHGHSQVGIEKSGSKALIRWVKRQRYQYRLSQEGKPSSMTQERVKALNNLDFIWDSHGSAWDDHFQELADYKVEFGHCNVSARYPKNQSLASWVKHQRRQYRMFESGEPTNMTTERIFKLEKMGFQWRLRKQNKK